MATNPFIVKPREPSAAAGVQLLQKMFGGLGISSRPPQKRLGNLQFQDCIDSCLDMATHTKSIMKDWSNVIKRRFLEPQRIVWQCQATEELLKQADESPSKGHKNAPNISAMREEVKSWEAFASPFWVEVESPGGQKTHIKKPYPRNGMEVFDFLLEKCNAAEGGIKAAIEGEICSKASVKTLRANQASLEQAIEFLQAFETLALKKVCDWGQEEDGATVQKWASKRDALEVSISEYVDKYKSLKKEAKARKKEQLIADQVTIREQELNQCYVQLRGRKKHFEQTEEKILNTSTDSDTAIKEKYKQLQDLFTKESRQISLLNNTFEAKLKAKIVPDGLEPMDYPKAESARSQWQEEVEAYQAEIAGKINPALIACRDEILEYYIEQLRARSGELVIKERELLDIKFLQINSPEHPEVKHPFEELRELYLEEVKAFKVLEQAINTELTSAILSPNGDEVIYPNTEAKQTSLKMFREMLFDREAVYADFDELQGQEVKRRAELLREDFVSSLEISERRDTDRVKELRACKGEYILARCRDIERREVDAAAEASLTEFELVDSQES